MIDTVEVWLTQKNLTVRCMVVADDETVTYLPVKSLNMRGAQREISGRADLVPVGRWKQECGNRETSRKFRKGLPRS